MGKKIAILHTVSSVYNTFPDMVREAFPDATIYNTVDEFLPINFQIHNRLTAQILNRLHALLRVAESGGVDAIIVSCSTMSSGVKALRPMFDIPLLPIDEAMLSLAVKQGDRITIIGTAHSAVDPGAELMRLDGAARGRKMDVEAIVLDSPAFVIASKRDMAARDQAILDTTAKLRNRDAIVLAQASMVHLEEPIAKATGIKTLSSPKTCLAELRRVLGK